MYCFTPPKSGKNAWGRITMDFCKKGDLLRGYSEVGVVFLRQSNTCFATQFPVRSQMSEWRSSHGQYIWQTNDLNQTSSLNCVIKPHTRKWGRASVLTLILCITPVYKTFWKGKIDATILVCSSVTSLLKGVHQTLPTSVFLNSSFYFLHLQLTAQIGNVMRAKAKVRARKNSTFHVFSLTILGKDSPARHHCARRKPLF